MSAPPPPQRLDLPACISQGALGTWALRSRWKQALHNPPLAQGTVLPHTYTHMCTRVLTYMYAHIHTCVHTCTHPRMCTECMRAYARGPTCTCARTHTPGLTRTELSCVNTSLHGEPPAGWHFCKLSLIEEFLSIQMEGKGESKTCKQTKNKKALKPKIYTNALQKKALRSNSLHWALKTRPAPTRDAEFENASQSPAVAGSPQPGRC